MRYCGKIGFVINKENPVGSGVYVGEVTEKKYFGDVIRVSRRLQSTDKVNDDVDISNEISIVADAFANHNFQSIRYAEWMGTKWKVSNITVEPPRLTMSLGGVYNGQT